MLTDTRNTIMGQPGILNAFFRTAQCAPISSRQSLSVAYQAEKYASVNTNQQCNCKSFIVDP